MKTVICSSILALVVVNAADSKKEIEPEPMMGGDDHDYSNHAAAGKENSTKENLPTSDSSNLFDHDLFIVNWYLNGMRGIYYGLFRGFYHERQKPDPKCLSDSIVDDVLGISQFLAYGELQDIFKLADNLSNLYFENRNFCGGEKLF